MNGGDDADAPAEVRELLAAVRRRGIRLWSENGQLRYRAPRGSLSRDDVARIIALRGKLLPVLERAGVADAGPVLGPRRPMDRVPLTFSQLKYWSCEHLSDRTSARTVASAARLSGRLELPIMRRSIAAIVRRHEALRTRIVVVDGTPEQQIVDSMPCELEVADLRGVADAAQAAEIARLIHAMMLAPVRIGVGPLFGVQVMRLGGDEHVLVIALEHIVSDACSLQIILRDLLELYGQLVRGEAPSLPPIAIQFGDYAVWQRAAHASWMQRHGGYWTEHLAGCGRLRFPADAAARANGTGLVSLPVSLGIDMRTQLQDWCRAHRTTLAISIFTAFVALVLRWYAVPSAVIQYQTDGRFTPLVESTVGYFAAVLNLRVELQRNDRFLDLLQRVTDEYCRGYEHADSSYIDAQLPPFTANPSFNWVPFAAAAIDGPPGAAATLTLAPVHFSQPAIDVRIDCEPMLALFEREDSIVGSLLFPRDRFTLRTMEGFRDAFMTLLRELLRQPQQRVAQVTLPSCMRTHT